MKKIITALVAVAIMLVSAVPAFAVVSPVATTAPEPTTTTSTVTKNTSSTSPQTGVSDAIPYAVLALSVAACGVVAVKAVKSK